MSAYIPAIIVAVIIIALLVGLYFLSRYAKKLQEKQEIANEQMREMEQAVSLLVIDKKMMKITEAGFPADSCGSGAEAFQTFQSACSKGKGWT